MQKCGKILWRWKATLAPVVSTLWGRGPPSFRPLCLIVRSATQFKNSSYNCKQAKLLQMQRSLLCKMQVKGILKSVISLKYKSNTLRKCLYFLRYFSSVHNETDGNPIRKCLHPYMLACLDGSIFMENVMWRLSLSLSHFLSIRRTALFGHVAQLGESTPPRCIRLFGHTDASLDQLPDRSRRRCPGRPVSSGRISYGTQLRQSHSAVSAALPVPWTHDVYRPAQLLWAICSCEMRLAQDLEPTTNGPAITRTVALFIQAPAQDPLVCSSTRQCWLQLRVSYTVIRCCCLCVPTTHSGDRSVD